MNECLVNVMHSLAAKFINQSSKTIYFDEFSEISLYRLRSIVRDSSKTGNLKHRLTHKHRVLSVGRSLHVECIANVVYHVPIMSISLFARNLVRWYE